MLRLALALLVIGVIFLHSPERTEIRPSPEALRWLEQRRDEAAAAALGSAPAAEIVRQALTREEGRSGKPAR